MNAAIIAAIVAALVATSASAADAARWFGIAAPGGNSSLYFAPDTIRIPAPNKRRAWFRIEYDELQAGVEAGRPYNVVESLEYADCDTEETATRELVYLREDKSTSAVTIVHSSRRDDPKPGASRPGSVGELMLLHMCNVKAKSEEPIRPTPRRY